MLRQIVNRAKGRRKIKDKEICLEDAFFLLKRLNDGTRINVHYHAGDVHLSEKGIYPKEAADFVMSQFKVLGDQYSYIKHQIYSSKRDERHYLDLDHGITEVRIGANVAGGMSLVKASIDFIIEKEASERGNAPVNYRLAEYV